MSYCRWSSDNWRCDLYCYESDRGIETHVAGNRVVGEIPKVNMLDITEGRHEKFAADYKAQSDFLQTAERKPIDLPHAGESFTDPDLASFLKRVTDLREMGYNVPDYVFEEIREEMSGGPTTKGSPVK